MNVLLMGAGWIAEMVYIPFLSDNELINCIYIFDVDSEVVKEKFLDNKKVKVINQQDIESLSYQFVCILSPNFLHYTHLSEFFDKKATIIVEKPVCINSEEFEKLNAVVPSSNFPTVYVSTPFRYRKDMQSIKTMVHSGSLGDIYRVEISWLKRRGTPGSRWFTEKEKSGGGVLMDMGPHMLDLFYWLLGERSAKCYQSAMSSIFLASGDAYADWHKLNDSVSTTEVEDSCFAQLIYSDVSLALNLVWASNIENDYAQIRLYGTKAVADIMTSIGFSTNTLYQETTVNWMQDGELTVQRLPIEDRKEPFRKMIADVINAQKDNLADINSALIVMHDIFKLYQHAFFIRG